MIAASRSAALLDLARRAADRAREVVHAELRSGALPQASPKHDGSAVTALDLAVEESLRSFFAAATPGLAFFGEETAAGALPPGFEGWVVDPIDGTRQLLAGSPIFAVLICLVEADAPALAVIDYPLLGERLYAGPGTGCWFERGSARVAATVAAPPPLGLAGAALSAGGLHGTQLSPSDGAAYALAPVMRDCDRWLFIPDSYQHGCVARGHLHGAIDTLMQPWDIAAIIPCIREAGGCFADLGGERDILRARSLVTACDAALLEVLCDALRGSG